MGEVGEGKSYHRHRPQTSHEKSCYLVYPTGRRRILRAFYKDNSQMSPLKLAQRKKEERRETIPGKSTQLPPQVMAFPAPVQSQLALRPSCHTASFLGLELQWPILTLISALYLPSKSSGSWIQKSHNIRGDFSRSKQSLSTADSAGHRIGL